MENQEHYQGGRGPINNQYAKEWNNGIQGAAPDRSSHNLQHNHQEPQGWSTSLWSCCSPAGLCCMTCCLPCITFGKTDHRMRNDGNLEEYSCCNSACWIFCLASWCSVACIPAAMQRNDVREKYNLRGNFFKDFLASWCCTCCVLMQSDKEAEYREAQAMQRAALSTQPYQANNTGMLYPLNAGVVNGVTQATPPVTEPAPVHAAPYSEK